ncbi:MAG: polysaccharide deacetylase family protein [Candidatus Odinarchaeota archaeon]|nr:polysaccharide deacetylase family protein [Candidatus Odinarchaeota archaeon]
MITVYTNNELAYTLDVFFTSLGIPFSIRIDKNSEIPKIFLYDNIQLDIEYEKFKQIKMQLTHSSENISIKDEHGRVISKKIQSAPLLDMTIKEVLEKIKELAEQKSIPVIRKCTWPKNKPFAVCLTHDIDHIKPTTRMYLAGIKNFLRKKKIRSALAWMLNFLVQRNPWDLKRIVDIEKERNVKSTFFFLIERKHEKDTTSRLEDIKSMIMFLISEGFDVQLHGSYTSFDNETQLMKEKTLLEKIKGEQVEGIRQHYLRFDPTKTFQIQDRLGFKFDSTYGFHNQVGFRAGTSLPFHPYDDTKEQKLKLTEIPLILMDVTVIEYLKLPPSEAWRSIKHLLDMTKDLGTLLTVLWHNTFFDDATRDWRELYTKIIDFSIRHDAFIGTARQVYNWWSKREKAKIELIEASSDKIVWNVKGFEDFCVSVYLPEKWAIEGEKRIGKEIIIPVKDTTEIKLIKTGH